MSPAHSDSGFVGSIPEIYERYMVPLMFDGYAADLAARVRRCRPSSVLEIAAGTGVVTRHLAQSLPADVPIVATDLNPPMLDFAAAIGTLRPVDWRPADVNRLPFADGVFDVVVCQFGVMFFPDRSAAYAEVRRVLRPGGRFLFNVWDRIEHNEFADTVDQALQAFFPDDPPRFMARIPHGYFESAVIARDLADAGFTEQAEFATLSGRSRAASAREPAIAICQGTPVRNEIEARDASRLSDATDYAAAAITDRFGPGPVDGALQAHIVVVGRSNEHAWLRRAPRRITYR
jgi:ubiquinone/menaquinone biosynthesis C-methylase UbiE